MKKFQRKSRFILAAAVISGLVLAGCRGTEESAKETPPPVLAEPSATEMIQKELNELRASADSCKQQLGRAQQEKAAAAAHAADLESQVAELREKLKPVEVKPPEVVKPYIANEKDSYKQALLLFNSRKYKEAADTWQALLEIPIEPSLQDNCTYWLGECAYGQKNYSEAIEHFKKVFSYKISEKKDDAQVMIANAYLRMGDKAKAKEEYQRLIDKFPASPYAKKVKARLGTL